ncbi:hypothetical protein D3C77_738380 [compost metagenome]
MHGLIVADSFEVPNRRLRLSNGLISDFKFVDYYSAFSMEEPKPLGDSALHTLGRADIAELVGEYKRPGLLDLQAGLLRSFPRY